jgi:hypothetical protein
MLLANNSNALAGIAIALCAVLAVLALKILPIAGSQPAAAAPALPSSDALPVEPITQPASNGQRRYENATFHFSLFYPEDLRVLEYEESGGARTITFENPGDGRGFQVYVMPYEPAQITKDQIERDTASGAMKDPVATSVAGVEGIAFYGTNAIIGDTREVWIVNDGYLYEVVTYKPFDAWLTEILTTWQFI